METVLVFAELYRDEPLVKSTRLHEFVLLFNAFNDDVRLVGTWDPMEDMAHFGLLVKEVQTRWVVRTHPESPFDAIIRSKHGYEATRVPAGGKPICVLSSGEVLNFTFAPCVLRKDISVALFKTKSCEKEKEDLSVPKSKACLENLPAKVLFKILAHLPWMDLAFSLPFVSKVLFKSVKGEVDKEVAKFSNNFSELDFRGAFPTLKHLEVLCNLASPNCTKLVPMDRCFTAKPFTTDIETDLSDLSRLLFLGSQWNKLKTIVWKGIEAKHVELSWFQAGLRTARFPTLTVLVLRLKVAPVSWDIFDGVHFGELKELDLDIKVAMNKSKWTTFRASFPKLERLQIDVAPPNQLLGNVFPEEALAKASMPELKTLTLHGLGNMSGSLDYFFGVSANLVRLSGISRVNSRQEESSAGVRDGNWMLEAFPDVHRLEVSKMDVTWEKTPGVEHLRVKNLQFVYTHPVTLNKMINLESCLIVPAPKPFRDMSKKSLAGLLGLPSLEKLSLLGGSCVQAILDHVPKGHEIVAVKQLEIRFESRVNTYNLLRTRKLLLFFPKLTCLKIVAKSFDIDASTLLTPLKGRARGLLHLEIHVSNVVPKTDVKFPEDVERVFSDHYFLVLRQNDVHRSNHEADPRGVGHQDCFVKRSSTHEMWLACS